ncbi:MAG: glycosyltransferase [Atopobiaceae bacterium]|nr:glycosyltransferase [Atopobiaceae bacterium]
MPELLNSVFAQEGVDVRVLARDDGSCDSTTDLLRQYRVDGLPIDYYVGQNVGPVSSFNDLISHEGCDGFDFYAFCDQDDVWLPDKLRRAIVLLKECGTTDIPCLYCSNLDVVDAELAHLRYMHSPRFKPAHESLVVHNCAGGCTEVFNAKARELYVQGKDSAIEMHDYWMALVCAYMGVLVYDPESRILYRQHTSNVVGSRKNGITKAVSHLVAGNRRIRSSMLRDFLAVYESGLTVGDVRVLRAIPDAEESLLLRMRLLLSPKYVGHEVRVTVGFKLRVLLNRIY